MDKVDLSKEFSCLSEHWRPRVVAALNGQEVKILKFKGEFPWHLHENEDEMFLGVTGSFAIEFRDKKVNIGPGEFIVVPRGVAHRPVAEEEGEAVLLEPANVRNTGSVYDACYTAP